MTQLTIALDWTPNINHIGFFVAQELGYYQHHDLAVQIIDPSMDGYQSTPAKNVETGLAHLALAPMESVISYRTKSTPFDLIAVAALLQEDLSAIVVRDDAGIQSPKDLDGRTYASYKARYEDEIVRQMIQNDGGKGEIHIEYPQKLGIWNTILKGQSDATWIFMNWEGVEAMAENVPLRYFKMSDYHVPYSYSTVVVAEEKAIQNHKEAYTSFLSATREGYMHSRQHPEESIHVLKKYVPEHDQHIDLRMALNLSAPAFGTPGTWGHMKEENVQTFLDWLYKRQIETQALKLGELISHHLL